MSIIIGNIIGFIGSMFMILGGSIKDKTKSLMAQSMQLVCLAISNLVLGSISGFIISLISAFRNVLSFFNKLNKLMIGIIIVLMIVLTVKFNTLGFIGYLPLINNIVFILCMNTKDNVKFKWLTIFYMVLWLIHNVYIKAYSTSIFNTITIITSLITIYRIKSDKEKSS